MSVYIKDMDMPKNCDCCDFMTVEGEYGEPSCPFGLIIKCASEKHPDCPLVPVPEHGRSIDADALFKEIGADERFSILEAMYVQSLISAAPTIIPADHIGGVNEMVTDKEGEG